MASIGKKMQNAMNEQINAELASGYIYLAMAAYFESETLMGFANWMRVQAQEELNHAMKFYDFIVERGGRVTLTPIGIEKTEWESPLEAFEDAYAHEKKISALIEDLAALAAEEKDYMSRAGILDWFLDEQIEEEEQTLTIVDYLKLVGDSVNGLMQIDAKLGQRE